MSDDDAGVLASQWLPYLQMTLQDYKVGKRVAPDKMKPKLNELSAEELDAVAQFYDSEGGIIQVMRGYSRKRPNWRQG